MDILFNGGFCLFLFWLLGSTTHFTPGCKFDRALAPQGEITFYNSIACTISPKIYHGSAWHLARSLGSGGLGLYFLRLTLSSLSHCSRNSQYILIFCYDLISTDPTLPTDHGKRVI
ncbi:hypothetical protein EDB92DRAFT_1833999 [Lactarius akahatsu]|uniref:Secreted protein n=1 Tax=Lactarius akahatsu TaxID=416441 RepID=A0AAD4QC51_9AGAM|nr:hypothetical protein EDB92DRAFT_1833999 [Lactarius akahatsu]